MVELSNKARLRALVAILVWNDYENTRECLANAVQKVPAGESVSLDFVVIDNGSDDQVCQELQKTAAEYGAIFVRNDENFGFAAGYWIGLEACGIDQYDILILLNNDTCVTSESLGDICLEFARTNADMASPYVITAGENPRLWGAIGNLIPLIDVPRVFRKNAAACEVDFSSLPADASFLSGCCLLVKPSGWALLGGFDQKFFYSVEDVDLSRRAKGLGLSLKALRSARVVHKASESSGGWLSRFSVEHFLHGRGLLSRKKLAEGKRFSSFAQAVFDLVAYLPNRAVKMSGRRKLIVELVSLLAIYFGKRPIPPVARK